MDRSSELMDEPAKKELERIFSSVKPPAAKPTPAAVDASAAKKTQLVDLRRANNCAVSSRPNTLNT